MSERFVELSKKGFGKKRDRRMPCSGLVERLREFYYVIVAMVLGF